MMWVCVFTVMPVVAALLIRWYLMQIYCSVASSLREAMHLVVVWIAGSFLMDAGTYIFLIPYLTRKPRNWRFFADQSPWIWLSYGVLLGSGFAANWLYVRRKHSSQT